MESGTLNMSDSFFGLSQSDQGGALNLEESSRVSTSNCSFLRNTASTYIENFNIILPSLTH